MLKKNDELYDKNLNIDEKEYKYYSLNRQVARYLDGKGQEWFVDGEWIEDRELDLCLSDAKHDYGDWSIGDYHELTYEEAMLMTENDLTYSQMRKKIPETVYFAGHEFHQLA